MNREFARAGILFDEAFVRQIFFGGRGFVFGGIFIGTPIGVLWRRMSRTAVDPGPRKPEVERRGGREALNEGEPQGLLSIIGRGIKAGGSMLRRMLSGATNPADRGLHLRYHLTITAQEAAFGTRKRVAFMRDDHLEDQSTPLLRHYVPTEKPGSGRSPGSRRCLKGAPPDGP